MKHLTMKYILGLMLVLSSSMLSGHVVPGKAFRSDYNVCINEIMASNISTIADEDGDYEDWVEILNHGSQSINLEGWGLSDDSSDLFRFTFPSTVIEPGAYLLVWCSKKDRAVSGQPLHTSYGISASGEEIILTHPNGDQVDLVPATALVADVSWGRYPDGTGPWFFFDKPTPLAANASVHYDEILAAPTFSAPGGFYTTAFDLSISHPDPEVTIIYTLDGSEPDISNLDGTTYQYKNSFPGYPENPFGEILENSFHTLIYNEPISVYDRSTDENYFANISSTADFEPDYFPENPIAKATVIRAKVIKPGALNSPTLTHSYFVFPKGRARYSLPVVSLLIPENHLFDYYDGIYTAGIDFDTWRSENPDPIATGLEPANWSRRGSAWEYPGNVEFFYPDKQDAVINQKVGTRIHGNLSASYRNKSLRLYARDTYGKSTLDHKFFADRPHSSYKRLILRNSGQDYEGTYVKDASLHEVVKNLNLDIQAYAPAISFLNGEYWGILNIRERFDKHYLARLHGVDSENLDLIESGSEVDEGDLVAYNALVAFAQTNDLSVEANYEHISTLMDIDNFMDYYITEIYIANRDWPGSNIKCWRLRTDGYQPYAPFGHDGRFRWFFYDSDFAFGPEDVFDYDNLQAAYEHCATSSQIFAALLNNEGFKNRFITRFSDLMNTTFVPSRITGIIDKNIQRIAPEIAEHIARWEKPRNINTWLACIDVMHSFANVRPAYQRDHLREFFDLGEDLQVTVEIENMVQGYFKVNSIDVNPEMQDNTFSYIWSGTYFSGVPLRIEAKPKLGYKFSHWEGDVQNKEPVLSITPTSDLNLKPCFEHDPDAWVRIIHYWHFNDLPDEELESVEADFSVDDAGVITYPGTGAGYMDRRTHRAADPVSNLNLQMGQEPDQGAVLRVRNPSNTRELIVTAPSTGFTDIFGAYATCRTSNGATLQALYYSTDGGEQWTLLKEEYEIFELPDWRLETFDLRGVTEADDNPDLMFKFLFLGEQAANDSGNDRFDNLSIHGTLIRNEGPEVVYNPEYVYVIENGESLSLDCSEFFSDPDQDELTFMVESSRQDFTELSLVSNLLKITGLRGGDTRITISAADGHNPPTQMSFQCLIYPEAFALAQGDFSFNEWDATTPELQYPEHMLFLQSDTDDPDANYPLNYAYYIAPDDYHADDAESIGFPYQLTGRSRLNGLGTDGISFINTGRGRDLGAALVALNTVGVDNASLSWLVGTLLENKRKYGLQVQYRVGIDGEFQLLSPTQLYQVGSDAEVRHFLPFTLPTELLNQEYVQLLFRYYHMDGSSGKRAMLRLDDISVSTEVEDDFPIRLAHISLNYTEESQIMISWESWQEDGLKGYLVYRNDNEDFDTADRISHYLTSTESGKNSSYQFVDNQLLHDGVYYYWVQGVLTSGESKTYGPFSYYWDSSLGVPAPVPNSTSLGNIYPNPFKNLLYIPYSLAKDEVVKIEVYNLRGQKVSSFNLGQKASGTHCATWKAQDSGGKALPSGVYFIKLKVAGKSYVKKAMLIK